MYEYVRTAAGWVLCWGGADLYREEEPPSQVVPAEDGRNVTTRTREAAADREPVQTLSA